MVPNHKLSLRILLVGFLCGTQIFISILFGYKLWNNVFASTPWTPLTPPETGPETPPGVIFNSPQPQTASGTYHTSLSLSLTLDPNTFHTFYTLDGGEPDSLSSEYTGPITIPFSEGSTVNLKAIAYDGRGVGSDISQTSYSFDNTTPVSASSTEISTLIDNGALSTGGSSPTSTTEVTANVDTTIDISGTDGADQVFIPKNTIISRVDAAPFNAANLSSSEVATSSLSGISFNTPVSALQWGVAGLGLQFNNPITISIFVGNSYNGQTLSVVRSVSGTDSWTNDGIVSPATCVVSSGYCSFQATKASYYAVGLNTTPSTPSNNNNNSNNNSGGDQGYRAPGCTSTPPTQKPDLFKIITSKGKAKLIYTPVPGATGYSIIYGLKKGDERFGTTSMLVNNNQGAQEVTIGSLNPKLNYYFEVKANNGCTAGPWSDWIPAKPNGNRTVNKYRLVFNKKVPTLVNQFK